MTSTLAIARRELASFYRLPLGWIVTALFLFLSAVAFVSLSLKPGQPATLREFFELWWGLLLVVAPAVSMRLIADEIRSGTLENLLTSPASEFAVALGKFLGAAAFLVLCLAPTAVFPAVLASLARLDPGPILAGYLGMVLLGLAYLAVGLLFSSLTSSQTLAFLGTLFTLVLAEIASQKGSAAAPPPFDTALARLSVNLRLADFARGVIDSSHAVFFLTITFWCVTMAALILRIRRWR